MRKSEGRALPVVAAIAAVAALILGASLLQGLVTARQGVVTSPIGRPTPVAGRTTDLDLGQVSSEEQVAACLTPDFASDPSRVDLLYGVQQRRPTGSSPVFVLRNRSGDLRLCDEFGADGPAQLPLPVISDQKPVAFLTTGRRSWKCAGTSQVLDRFRMTTWLLVSPDVRTVQQRYWVDGRPGPWFTTQAQNGYVHLQSWLQGPEPAGTSYGVQYRVLDQTGSVLDQPTLPTGRQPLPGCAGNGSSELG